MQMGTGRLEAFSDGVFAIAVTLLILEVKVSGSGTLLHQLTDAWPSYAAFVVSFMMIGTMWINHHRMFHSLAVVDNTVLVMNLILLLVVSFIPFPTELVSENIAHGTDADARTAVVFYGLTFVAVSIAFPLLWWAIVRNPANTAPELTRGRARDGMRRNLLGLPTYSALTLLALASPTISLLCFGVVAIFYLLPGGARDE